MVDDSAELPLRQGTDPHLGLVVEGKYEIVRKLGEGGMGAVYEARRRVIDRRVAIKTLHAHLASHEDVVRRFLNEARAVNEIGHENILEIYDFGQFEDGAPFLVMELLEGEDLSELVDRVGPLSLGRAARIVRQVCDALSATHRKNIVHRDLKPENVFLTQNRARPDFVKVLDFGVSKFRGQESHLRTKTGVAVGTPYFMAPEQARGKSDLDHRADIYALGVLLYNVLTNDYPFVAESQPELLVKILVDPPLPLDRRRPDLPVEVVELVHRMVEKEPDARPTTAAEVGEVLARFVTEDSPAPVSLQDSQISVPPEKAPNPGLETPVPSLPWSKEPTLVPPPPAEVPVATPTVETSPAPRWWLPVAGGVLLLAGIGVGAGLLWATPDDITVVVSAQPDDALLFLDDQPVPNPYVFEGPATGDVRTVRAVLGDQAEIRHVSFDGSQAVSFLLRDAIEPSFGLGPESETPSEPDVSENPSRGEVDDEPEPRPEPRPLPREDRARNPAMGGSTMLRAETPMARAPEPTEMVLEAPSAMESSMDEPSPMTARSPEPSLTPTQMTTTMNPFDG
ncbi:MAG: serine/threonine-protein kinase [Myxococcota bacterium]